MDTKYENEGVKDNTDSGNCKSSSSYVVICKESPRNISNADVFNFSELSEHDYQLADQNARIIIDYQTSNTSNGENINLTTAGHFPKGESIEEPMCDVKLDSLIELKISTKKLISLLEDIQTKTQIRNSVTDLNVNPQNEITIQIPTTKALPLLSEILKCNDAAKTETETQGKTFEAAFMNEDDCTVFKKLTRRCQCFNQQEYNDFVIKFNDTKYFTSTMGEIIKNMRILKKFIYVEGDFAKHALMFLNEGLSDSTDEEKVDIAQGCAYADICNVFDDHSIVTNCISWLCKRKTIGNMTTQALAASFLFKLAHLEDGLRYLSFSSKIKTDLKKVLRKKAAHMESDTLESLNATLNILHPPLIQFTKAIYYCKTAETSQSVKICKKCDYQSPYRYRRQISTNTYAAALQNVTIKRPKIIPSYTD